MTQHPKILVWFTLLLAMLLAAACAPSAAPETEPEKVPTVEPATPTPEVFNPLTPSPTPLDSALPLACQVTDLKTYVSEAWGYCLAFPLNFTLDDSQASSGIISLYGPPVVNNRDPVPASVEITAQPVPEASNLSRLVDGYLRSLGNLPWAITRQPLSLGGESAERLEPVPGLLSSQLVLALHNNVLYSVRFQPSDVQPVNPELEAAAQTVMGSFTFLTEATPPQSQMRTLSWSEFGQRISLSYDPVLAPWVKAETIPAVPISDQTIFAESRPAYVRVRFDGFHGGRIYDLPLLPVENIVAQVMVFQTRDFPSYGGDHPSGFVAQQQALDALLDAGLDANQCLLPYAGAAQAMPFLPWLNSQQTFCAKPQFLEFSQGRGVRYLTYYSQGPNPVLDRQVFYTFQGKTNDEQFYISAVFPVQTGIFPNEPPPCPKCGQPDYNPLSELMELMSSQLAQLNALPEQQIAPQLALLDEVIRSLHIELP